jgi:hypothetical protein
LQCDTLHPSIIEVRSFYASCLLNPYFPILRGKVYCNEDTAIKLHIDFCRFTFTKYQKKKKKKKEKKKREKKKKKKVMQALEGSLYCSPI